jgi:hypothetical protein
MDPHRRERFDKLGRVDPSKVTPERVNLFMDEIMASAVAAGEGILHDNPKRDNILDKIKQGLDSTLKDLEDRVRAINSKLERVSQLSSRFIVEDPKAPDPVADSLKLQQNKLMEEKNSMQDTKELILEVVGILDTYTYRIDPPAEGQFAGGSTIDLMKMSLGRPGRGSPFYS